MREIRSAVERIDEPSKGRAGFKPTALFSYDGMLGKMRAQAADHGFLGAPVRLGDQVYIPLVADLHRSAEFGNQDFASLERGFHGYVEEIIHSAGPPE